MLRNVDRGPDEQAADDGIRQAGVAGSRLQMRKLRSGVGSPTG
jgi:hypothetical protein